MQYENLWQEWQFPVFSESCETTFLQHSQDQEDHYFLILSTPDERTGKKYTSATQTRIRHMSNNVSQARHFWKKTGTSCFSLEQTMWIWSPSRLGWPGHRLILSSCNQSTTSVWPSLSTRSIIAWGPKLWSDVPYVYPQILQGKWMLSHQNTDTALWRWTSMCLYKCVGTDYRNKKPGINFSHFWAQLIDV